MLDLLEILSRLLEKEDSHSDSNFVGEKQDKFEDCLSKLKISKDQEGIWGLMSFGSYSF